MNTSARARRTVPSHDPGRRPRMATPAALDGSPNPWAFGPGQALTPDAILPADRPDDDLRLGPDDAQGLPYGSAARNLTDRVRARMAADGIEISPEAVAAAVRLEPSAAELPAHSLRALAARLAGEMTGAGPLAPLLADPDVTDVLVNGVTVWVDRGGGLRRVLGTLRDEAEVRKLAKRLASNAGRRLDEASPFVDACLPDGTRMHAVLPPIAIGGPYLSLRTFRRRAFTIDELVSCGTVDPGAASLLRAVVAARLPYLVTGGTGTGKTTVLATLLSAVPPGERMVVVEDAAELRPVHPHVVCLQSRAANVEGAGIVTLRDLVRQALRMRPDRLVVGECRGAEVVDLLGALNTGHEGGAATLHANSPADVPARLEALGLLGGVPRAALHAMVLSALRVVVHLHRDRSGRRELTEVCVIAPDRDRHIAGVLTAWRRGSGPGPGAGELDDLLSRRGIDAPKPDVYRHYNPVGGWT
ncbi:TadA family conjugal transfer-associated ATPase [Dactylosporangium sp. NPDC051485]|uniref:TadA family conjugal transfer-associated ATPase n=1 Tax=Dactylosporangium sp. NPDC051485 TaxID=3154846 RepID=UPI00343EE973